jgi:hypothetical protein
MANMKKVRSFVEGSDLAKVALIWAISRIVTFAAYLGAFTFTRHNFSLGFIVRRFPAFVDTWDARWYRKIFVSGYPHTLPHDSLGNVTSNAWAFLPGYPLTVRTFNFVLHRGWNILSPAVAVLFGFFAAWILFLILRDIFGKPTALWAVVLFSFCAVSPIFQTGYAESMALFFTLFALRLTIQGKYLWALVPLALWSLTRPGELAFSMVFVVLAFIAWRKKEQLWRLLVAAGGSAFLGVLWPLIAWASTGVAGAYFATENAWREKNTGSTRIYLVESWFVSANHYFGVPVGPILVLAVWAVAAWILFLPSVRRLGAVIRLWIAAYFVYLILVFYPQSSTLRILIPNLIIVGAFATATIKLKSWLKVLVVFAFVATQVLWIVFFWDAHVGNFPP